MWYVVLIFCDMVYGNNTNELTFIEDLLFDMY